jgi:hypothetical protein
VRRDVATVLATVAAIGVVAVAATAVVYAKPLTPRHEPPIRSDALSYYLYLPAALLDHDLTFRRTLARSFDGDYRVADLVPRRHAYLDKHPVGEALMLLPFFGGAQLAADLGGSRRNGFARPYQVAAVAGGIVYALLGLALTGSALLRWFGGATVAVTLLLLTFGTNLFHYATYDAVYSHVFSFCLVAVVLDRSAALAAKSRTRDAATVGAAVGLLGDVRLTNLVFAAFPVLLLVGRLRRMRPIVVGVATAALLFVPQILYWERVTGHPFVNAYGGDPTLRPLHPHLVAVAFSVRKGLFFWAPLLALAVAGLFMLSRRLAFAAAVTLALHFWIVASWTQWWYGGSLGQRSFVDALPLYALGLAAAVAAAARASPVRRYAAYAAFACTTALAVHATLEYWLGNIPPDLTTWHVYVKSFRQI